jgi:hypothetical protein
MSKTCLINTLIKKLFTIALLALPLVFSGCSVSDFQHKFQHKHEQKNNAPQSSWVKTEKDHGKTHQLTKLFSEHFAQQFGEGLAEHILSHPNITDDIHCQTIPTNFHELHGDDVSANAQAPSQLCTLEVMIYEPVYVNKVNFFVKNNDGSIKVLNILTKSGSSSFSSFEFSEKGKYLTVVFTDEGHPFFVFFETQKFIKNPEKAQVGEVFEEYYLDHIETFYDNGDFIFALREETIYGCLSGEIEIEPKTDTTEEVKRCLFHHNIFDEYNSFSSRKPFTPSRSKRSVKMPYVCHAYD